MQESSDVEQRVLMPDVVLLQVLVPSVCGWRRRRPALLQAQSAHLSLLERRGRGRTKQSGVASSWRLLTFTAKHARPGRGAGWLTMIQM